MKESLYAIANLLDLKVEGPDRMIYGFNLCNREIKSTCVITYCTSVKYVEYAIRNPKVGAIILSQELYDTIDEKERGRFSYIISNQPEWCFYDIFITMHAKDSINKNTFDTDMKNVSVGIGTTVEKGVKFGENVVIGCNSVIKSGTIIGNNVKIGSCTVIGADGFQIIRDGKGSIHTIPHVGGVYIGNDVYIGNNTSIHRSLFEGFTTIGDNTKISDQVIISHNCTIGTHCVLCGNNTLYGSCELKDNVWIAPDASIMNQIIIEEGAFIGGSSLVGRTVKAGQKNVRRSGKTNRLI